MVIVCLLYPFCLFFSRHSSCSADDSPYHLNAGEEYIEEEILGVTLQLYPDSYLIPNTESAELICRAVGELIQPNPNSTLLDIHCGTGKLYINTCNARILNNDKLH